jgi:sigma-B regulation protein RsbU (phosphoserine phosphatase)
VGSFAAVFVAICDTSTSQLCYINAGHYPEPWRLPAKGGEPARALSDARTMILGIEPTIVIKSSELLLDAGDTILLASDGLVENRNVNGELYGIDRFEQFVNANRQDGVEALVGLAVNEMEAFSKDAEPSDDRTILAFQIKGRVGEEPQLKQE